MRIRRLLSIGLVVAIVAWWWLRERAHRPTDAVSAQSEVEHRAAVPKTGDEITNANARAEVASFTPPVTLTGVERINTVDEHDVAVADVELFDVRSGELIKLGTTDVSGELVLANPLRGPARIRTRVSSELEQDHEVPADAMGTFVVHVDTGDAIRGLVTLPDGSQPPVEVTVIAWTDDAGQNVRELAASVMQGDRGAPQARTAANGSFTIQRMRRGAKYAITAGAFGFMAKTYPMHASAGGPEITLVVQPVYAAVVKFVDAQTRGPVHVSQRLIPRAYPQAKLIEADFNVKPGILGGGNGVLAGMPNELFADGQNLRRHVEICMDDSAPAHVGPFQLQVDLPGYEHAQLEFFAEPLARGLHEVELAFVPTAHERGQLAIRWIGVPDALRVLVRPALTWSTVTLESSVGPPLVYRIDDFSGPQLVLDEIPFGDYVASVALQSGVQGKQPIEPGRNVHISSVRAVIDVDISRFGALAFDVRRADGSAFDGVLGIALGRESSGGFNSFLFRGAPYVVLGLQPNRWNASLMKPMVPGSDQVAEVKAGELATLKFVLP